MKKIIDNDAKLVQSAFRKLHKKIFDNFDLGSPKMLFLTISKDAGMLFNTKDLSYKKVKAETLGKEIAETILLSLECSNVEFGDWINKQSLPNLKVIEKLDSEDFYLDVELKKFWIMARIICNKIIFLLKSL